MLLSVIDDARVTNNEKPPILPGEGQRPDVVIDCQHEEVNFSC
jgi:hypothetical protein